MEPILPGFRDARSPTRNLRRRKACPPARGDLDGEPRRDRRNQEDESCVPELQSAKLTDQEHEPETDRGGDHEP